MQLNKVISGSWIPTPSFVNIDKPSLFSNGCIFVEVFCCCYFCCFCFFTCCYCCDCFCLPAKYRLDVSNSSKMINNSYIFSLLPQTTSDLAYQMISAIDEYGHHSINKTIDIHIEAANVVLIAVKVSVNSSVSEVGKRQYFNFIQRMHSKFILIPKV